LKKFQLILSNEHGAEFPILFELLETVTAMKWYELLKEYSHQAYSIRERQRFHHFCSLDAKKELEAYNRLVDRINKASHVQIPFLETVRLPTLEELNFQHRFFEEFRGSVFHPHKDFSETNHEVRKLWEDLNVWIHKLEDFQGTPRIVVTFQEATKIPLELEDFKQFKLEESFGDVFVNYCQVGKHPLEAYLADDDLITSEVLRPLEFMSADFRVRFCSGSHSFVDDRRKLNQWLVERGVDPNNPRSAVGWIQVARLSATQDQSKLVDEISRHQRVQRVEIIGG